MRGLNNILKNKNTVTILGIVVIVFLLFIGFNATINSTVNPVSVPVAKRKILPGTQIKQDDVKYTNVSRIVLSDNVLTNLNDILLKYSNYNVTIPENSMFYKEWLVGEGDVPGNWLKKIDFSKGEEAYYYKVDEHGDCSSEIQSNFYEPGIFYTDNFQIKITRRDESPLSLSCTFFNFDVSFDI